MIKKFLKEENDLKSLFSIDFLLYFSNFLLVPILSIYLKNELFFTSDIVGLIIGIPSFIACFLGILSYMFYKKIGPYFSIIFCLILDNILIFALLLKANFLIVIFCFILKGISYCIFMPMFKSLYIYFLKNDNNRNLLFKIKYIMICASAVIAPFISSSLYPLSKKLIFVLIFFINVYCIYLFSKYKNKLSSIVINKEKKSLKLILKEKSFLLFLIGTIALLCVFSQFEGTFSLTQSKDALNTFTNLLILNSILGIVFQLIIIKFFKRFSSHFSLLIGCLCFSVAFYCFYLANENYIVLLISIIFFTWGETLSLPNIDIFITEISTDNNRLLLYSISEFKRIGFFLGPFISGILLEKYSPNLMFISFSFISIFSFIIFSFILYNHSKK